jgi:hypothetical protein
MSENKFLHEEVYRGADSLAKLKAPLIVVCGAGALGSNLIDNLTRQGCGNIRVIDRDRVETHNINTQIWAEADVGALKTAALKNRVFRAVGVEIDAVNRDLAAGNVKNTLKGANLVVDCFDNRAARLLVQTACRQDGLPLIHGGLSGDGYGECVHDDCYRVPKDQTEGDACDYPMARNVIMLTVMILSEEILDFFLAKKPRHKSWSITLRDLKVSEMRLSLT